MGNLPAYSTTAFWRHQPVRCLAEVQGVLGHHVPTLAAHRHGEPPCSRVTQA